MSNTQAAALIVGLLMPALISIVKQAGLARVWNLAIAIASCAVAGVLIVWATGGFAHVSAANILGAIGIVIVASQAVYAGYWQGAGVETKLNMATSIIKPPPDQPPAAQ